MIRPMKFMEDYEKGTAQERAELIYANFGTFSSILEDCKTKLIYDIQAEEQFFRSQHRDELGVRIQSIGHNSDPTAQQAVKNVMLDNELSANDSISISNVVPKDAQEVFIRKHRILVIMREEYIAFDRHLRTLKAEDRDIMLSFLTNSMDYQEIATKTGMTYDTVRKRVATIRLELIKDMTDYYIDTI